MKMHSIYRLSLVLALACMMISAHAQSKIGIVDVDKIIASSSTVSAAVKKAEASLKVRQDQIDAKMTEMQQARTELDRKGSVMSADQVKSEEAKIAAQREEIKDLQYQTNKELERIRQQVMPPEVDRIMEAVREIAQRDGYDLILPAETVLFHAEKTDITPMIIQMLDKSETGAAVEKSSDDSSKDSDTSEKASTKSSKSSGKTTKSTTTRRARPHLPKND